VPGQVWLFLKEIMNKTTYPKYYLKEVWAHIDHFDLEQIKKFDKDRAVAYACAKGFIDSGMNACEVAFIYDFLEVKGACNIVELGRNFGCSTRMFIQHVVRNGGYFESWDLKHWGNLNGTFMNQGFRLNGQEDDIHFADYPIKLKVANSLSNPIEEGRWIDFLLIDTEHGVDNAFGEFVRWLEHLKDNAFVVFHDATLSGVAKSLEMIEESYADQILNWYELEHTGGYGITLLELTKPSQL
jgi:predicted O-methyltransferase YrrM